MGDAMSVQVRGNRYWVESKGSLRRQLTDSGAVYRGNSEPFVSHLKPGCVRGPTARSNCRLSQGATSALERRAATRVPVQPRVAALKQSAVTGQLHRRLVQPHQPHGRYCSCGFCVAAAKQVLTRAFRGPQPRIPKRRPLASCPAPNRPVLWRAGHEAHPASA